MEEHHLIRLLQMILLLGLKTIYTLMQKNCFWEWFDCKRKQNKKQKHTQRVIQNIISIEHFFGTIPTSDMWLKETFVDIIDVFDHWRFLGWTWLY